jgi:hypothetical protein
MFSCNLNQFLSNMAASKLTAYCVEKKNAFCPETNHNNYNDNMKITLSK